MSFRNELFITNQIIILSIKEKIVNDTEVMVNLRSKSSNDMSTMIRSMNTNDMSTMIRSMNTNDMSTMIRSMNTNNYSEKNIITNAFLRCNLH